MKLKLFSKNKNREEYYRKRAEENEDDDFIDNTLIGGGIAGAGAGTLAHIHADDEEQKALRRWVREDSEVGREYVQRSREASRSAQNQRSRNLERYIDDRNWNIRNGGNWLDKYHDESRYRSRDRFITSSLENEKRYLEDRKVRGEREALDRLNKRKSELKGVRRLGTLGLGLGGGALALGIIRKSSRD